MTKKIAVALTAIMLFVLAACATPVPPQTAENKAEAETVSATLNEAAEIRLEQHFKITNKSWSVKVDGTELATVEGVHFAALGDTLTILSTSGGVIASEEEQILTFAKTAKFFDADGNTTGTLKKKVLSLLAEYRLTDENGAEKAKLDQKFALLFKGEIKDANGKTVWKFDSDLGLTAKVNLTRVERDTDVSAEDAIRMVIVAAVVEQAQNNDSSK